MKITTRSARSLDVSAPPAAAFALLADIPETVAHTPSVRSAKRRVGGWRWKYEEVGAGPVGVGIVYTSRYHHDGDRRVWWEAVDGGGNTRCYGTWTVAGGPAGAHLEFETTVEAKLGFPSLLKPVVKAVVKREVKRICREYVDNMGTTLGGGDGRVADKPA